MQGSQPLAGLKTGQKRQEKWRGVRGRRKSDGPKGEAVRSTPGPQGNASRGHETCSPPPHAPLRVTKHLGLEGTLRDIYFQAQRPLLLTKHALCPRYPLTFCFLAMEFFQAAARSCEPQVTALENALRSFVLLPLCFPGMGLNFLLGFEGYFCVFPLIPLTAGQVSALSCLQEPPELLPGHQLLIWWPVPLFPAVPRRVLRICRREASSFYSPKSPMLLHCFY